MKAVDIEVSKETEGKNKKITINISFPLFGYIVRRIFIFLPTLFAISLLTFILISAAPGDPAETMLNRSGEGGEGQASDKLATDKSYQDLRASLGLDMPVFYLSPGSLASCDTLGHIAKQEQRETLDRMIYEYGNWNLIEKYYSDLCAFELAVLNTPKDSASAGALIEIRNNVGRLYLQADASVISGLLDNSKDQIKSSPALAGLSAPLSRVRASIDQVATHTAVWRRYIPVIHWNGTQNQYHRWLFGNAKWFGTETDPTKTKGFIRGDFGISYFSKRPVSSVLWDGLWITMLISICIILIEYLISIPLGVFSAVSKGSRFDSVASTSLFILYSLPSFWIGTMAIFFLCGGDYLNIFPPFGIGDTTLEDGFWVRAGDLSYHLILPLIVGSYGGLAFLSRQMRGGMLSVLRQDFIRTAYAKGLDQNTVVWKHALRNSLLPIITIFANVFPALIGGSLILEFLFTIPGLGQITYAAVLQKDYPMILTNTMFAAILTLLGYLIADILYAVADPRISYSSTKK
jgi:peptide/nickel transport system permease protein